MRKIVKKLRITTNFAGLDWKNFFLFTKFFKFLLYCIEKTPVIYENISMLDNKRLRNLGINIKSERLRRSISQEKLAELTNISRNSVSLIETGKINPTILKVIDIAHVLDIDVNVLLRDV